jgi:hypothetical protein
MRNCIGRIFEPLRRVLQPRQGRHRTVKASPPVICGDAPTSRMSRVRQVSTQPTLHGEEVGLVRPYLVAHERRQERGREGSPRVALVCPPHGMVVVR